MEDRGLTVSQLGWNFWGLELLQFPIELDVRTSNIEVHAQARSSERMTFGLETAAWVNHVLSSVLYGNRLEL